MIRFPRKVVSAVNLMAKTKNWPTALADHAGLKKNSYICQARSGQKIAIRPGTDDSRIFFEIYVQGCYSAATIKQGATIIDIGANIGCFSLFGANEATKIIACEPHPENARIMKENIALNNFSNIVVVQKAISGKSGSMDLIAPNEDGHSGRHSLYDGRGDRSIQIDAITLQTLLQEQNITDVDLIKIDCQGAEYDILFSSASVLKSVQQIIVECEVFETRPEWTQKNLSSFLSKNGYEVSQTANLIYARRT